MEINAVELLKESWQDLRGRWKPFYTVASIYGITVIAVQILAEILYAVHLGLIGWTISTIFTILLGGGFTYAVLKFVRGEKPEIIDVFALFEDMGLGANYVLMSVLKNIITAIGFFLLLVPGIYLSVGYMFSSFLMLDKGLSPWEALETSRKTVHKNWFQYFLFVLVLIIVNIIGAIPLGLGLIVTLPISYIALTKLYYRVFDSAF